MKSFYKNASFSWYLNDIQKSQIPNSLKDLFKTHYLEDFPEMTLVLDSYKSNITPSNITSIMRMFDLPKPVEELIDTIGLGSPEDNEFANVINTYKNTKKRSEILSLVESVNSSNVKSSIEKMYNMFEPHIESRFYKLNPELI